MERPDSGCSRRIVCCGCTMTRMGTACQSHPTRRDKLLQYPQMIRVTNFRPGEKLVYRLLVFFLKTYHCRILSLIIKVAVRLSPNSRLQLCRAVGLNPVPIHIMQSWAQSLHPGLKAATRELIISFAHTVPARLGLGLMVWSTGASRQLLNVLYLEAGLCSSFTAINHIIESLANDSIDQAKLVSSGPHVLAMTISTSRALYLWSKLCRPRAKTASYKYINFEEDSKRSYIHCSEKPKPNLPSSPSALNRVLRQRYLV